jgi:hypothetical protein
MLLSLLARPVTCTLGVLAVTLVAATCADGTGPTGEPPPPHVRAVRPADGQQVQAAELDEVCISFLFQAGQGLGETPQQRITVFFNGGDVTREVRWTTTRDVPTSEGAGCFSPPVPLHDGWHTARVVYSDLADRQFQYEWRFRVVD